MNVPPLKRRITTPENECDNVWYGFFRNIVGWINNNNTNTTSGTSNLRNLVNVVYDIANTANNNASNRMYGNLTGGAGGWEDLRFPASAINPPGAVGPPSYDTTNIGWSFSATQDERIDVVAQLPHAWKRGSDIHPHLHFRPLTNVPGWVVWQVHESWSNSLGNQPPFTIYYANIFLNPLVDGNIVLKEFLHGLGGGTPPGPDARESSIVKYKLVRLGTATQDNYAGPVLLDEFDIHYYAEKSGTDPEIPV